MPEKLDVAQIRDDLFETWEMIGVQKYADQPAFAVITDEGMRNDLFDGVVASSENIDEINYSGDEIGAKLTTQSAKTLEEKFEEFVSASQSANMLQGDLKEKAVEDMEAAEKSLIDALAKNAAKSSAEEVEDNEVFLPDAEVSQKAYDDLTALGLPSITFPETKTAKNELGEDVEVELGGLGQSNLVQAGIAAIAGTANMSFLMHFGLTHGVANALLDYGSAEIMETFLTRLIEGTDTATMCLTEPNAGSDVGGVITEATPNGDGTDSIDGTKIFISSGDHSLTDNIHHLVLARRPDAPTGTRGLSLFMVPKYKIDENGDVAKDAEGNPIKNGVTTARLEEKEGVHANPTAQLDFKDATGYLVGEEGKGFKAMLVVMKEERLMVAGQGQAALERNSQAASNYTGERKQFNYPVRIFPQVDEDVTFINALADAGRIMIAKTTLDLDISKGLTGASDEEREKADRRTEAMTPVLKAFITDYAVEASVKALQKHGGMGFIKETGIGQTLRDTSIAPIWEGTNDIQATDLATRKGQLIEDVLVPIREFLEENSGKEDMKKFVEPIYDALLSVEALAEWNNKNLEDNPGPLGQGASMERSRNLLHAVGLLTAGVALAENAEFQEKKIADKGESISPEEWLRRKDKVKNAEQFMAKTIGRHKHLVESADIGVTFVRAAPETKAEPSVENEIAGAPAKTREQGR